VQLVAGSRIVVAERYALALGARRSFVLRLPRTRTLVRVTVAGGITRRMQLPASRG
jgi:hypothetical protein